jgi:serine/threonine protein kinase
MNRLETCRDYNESTGNMQRALLRTAQEVAKGMDYIHSFGIIHGDLKPGNVLLKTHRIDRRGYIAKVSDFGEPSPRRFPAGGKL